jgi:hypothetical protein
MPKRHVTKGDQEQRLLSEREEGNSTFNRNVGEFLPDYGMPRSSIVSKSRLLLLCVDVFSGTVITARYICHWRVLKKQGA